MIAICSNSFSRVYKVGIRKKINAHYVDRSVRKWRMILTLWAGRSRSLFSLMTFQICCELNENPNAGTTTRRSPANPPEAIECWNVSLKLETFRNAMYCIIHISIVTPTCFLKLLVTYIEIETEMAISCRILLINNPKQQTMSWRCRFQFP